MRFDKKNHSRSSPESLFDLVEQLVEDFRLASFGLVVGITEIGDGLDLGRPCRFIAHGESLG